MDKRQREALDRWLTTPPEDMYPDFPDDYSSVIAPCGQEVFGYPDNIDSGLRKHIDVCEDCQNEKYATEQYENDAAADLDPEWPGHGD